ncbi:response regulator [Desulfotignum phosphitoxidans]|uniref:Polar-differentiation response regulator DivK n=1 Tax=Desulfotignum phosphitoxidans DSM 13687 TaxID=1286635 RepID=S0FRS0_9BACT|nr:response regulator [Desulfotignum phosphitoxidans]EMS77410.1 polar-differentiation response regulator DivK [Desulfotignum phosphitoxidans DSM 13687]
MKKILIIEDNEKNLKLFSIITRSLGYEILTAENGAKGVAIAKKEFPRLVLILMDIQMPVMDGITALNMLKSDQRTAGIPVIALTSFAMAGDRKRLLAEGFTGYISKPIDKNQFLKSVKKTIKVSK